MKGGPQDGASLDEEAWPLALEMVGSQVGKNPTMRNKMKALKSSALCLDGKMLLPNEYKVEWVYNIIDNNEVLWIN